VWKARERKALVLTESQVSTPWSVEDPGLEVGKIFRINFAVGGFDTTTYDYVALEKNKPFLVLKKYNKNTFLILEDNKMMQIQLNLFSKDFCCLAP